MNATRDDFSERVLVQLPAMLHLLKLRYQYYRLVPSNKNDTSELEQRVIDSETNILCQVFCEQYAKLNPSRKQEAGKRLHELKQFASYDDLGKSFYQELTRSNEFIDFEHPENNVYHFTGELTYENDGKSFRPDITLFVNGLPLVFIEVKKQNNPEGILAEVNRMNNDRIQEKRFTSFLNLTQFMIFSNDMEYSDAYGSFPTDGAFYCTNSRSKVKLNVFREENPYHHEIADFIKNYDYVAVDPQQKAQICRDFRKENYSSPLTHIQEINSPTNRIITSLCSPQRLLFLLKYGIAYLNDTREIDGKMTKIEEKHIIRYQQLFAALAVKRGLEQGIKQGIIWHTQGSGKTALSYFLTKIIRDFYKAQNIVAKFYFIVDRLDLRNQAISEFEMRGLHVVTPKSKVDFFKQLQSIDIKINDKGNDEITVVNIHKFEQQDKFEKIENPYNLKIQRIFIIDEAHRSYSDTGKFLGELVEADPEAIKLALTGTPLLKDEVATKNIFGNYIHIYYYDQAIRDGVTLRIMREDVETSFRQKLISVYDALEEKNISDLREARSKVLSAPEYYQPLTQYIIKDLIEFRRNFYEQGNKLGGMVICESTKQAKSMYEYFNQALDKVNQERAGKGLEPLILKAGLVLHNESKEYKEEVIVNFKKNYQVDILFVCDMLLTGFDAPRLKRLYFGKKLNMHTLLQALTRVNRPFEGMKYGYVVDFADIKENFDKTSELYEKELAEFYAVNDKGENIVGNLLGQMEVNPEETTKIFEECKALLSRYNYQSPSEFINNLSKVEDIQELVNLVKTLQEFQNHKQRIKNQGSQEEREFIDSLNIDNYNNCIKEIDNRIKNLKYHQLRSEEYPESFVNLDEIIATLQFTFKLRGREELKINSSRTNELEEQIISTMQEINSIHKEIYDKSEEDTQVNWKSFNEVLEKLNIHALSALDEQELEKNVRSLQTIKSKMQSSLDKEREEAKLFANDPIYLSIYRKFSKNDEYQIFQNENHQFLISFLQDLQKKLNHKLEENGASYNTFRWFRDIKYEMSQIFGIYSEELNISSKDFFDYAKNMLEIVKDDFNELLSRTK
ncbi:type I restriction endonuclease [Psittacicella gerlachiana]|uniref:type I site-specific deoxyribonuclease n=1 Tax=Psittacicella gerlachiana TaxID=2028574 RepID=A0A3A1YDT9_9GAMM|nr:type I restriction endonuclease [Psittacicella gerlachiana]RIY34297.1 hypothetical protein CKF59_05660 [Psittacicella gerlachiana]